MTESFQKGTTNVTKWDFSWFFSINGISVSFDLIMQESRYKFIWYESCGMPVLFPYLPLMYCLTIWEKDLCMKESFQKGTTNVTKWDFSWFFSINGISVSFDLIMQESRYKFIWYESCGMPVLFPYLPLMYCLTIWEKNLCMKESFWKGITNVTIWDFADISA